MTISNIDNSQHTAAIVAGFSCLFGMAIVIFANYAIYNPSLSPAMLRKPLRISWCTNDYFVSPLSAI